jgi:hypothetical protein
MSLFIAGQAFPGTADFAAAKVAVFIASILSAAIGVAVLWRAPRPGEAGEDARAGSVRRNRHRACRDPLRVNRSRSRSCSSTRGAVLLAGVRRGGLLADVRRGVSPAANHDSGTLQR